MRREAGQGPAPGGRGDPWGAPPLRREVGGRGARPLPCGSTGGGAPRKEAPLELRVLGTAVQLGRGFMGDPTSWSAARVRSWGAGVWWKERGGKGKAWPPASSCTPPAAKDWLQEGCLASAQVPGDIKVTARVVGGLRQVGTHVTVKSTAIRCLQWQRRGDGPEEGVTGWGAGAQ